VFDGLNQIAEDPSMVEVSIKLSDDTAQKMKLPVQLPHKVLEYLMSDCKLHIADGLVRKYWNHLEEVGDDTALQTRDFRRLASTSVWPLGIHGDEAAIGIINNPTNKVIGITLNIPLFRPRATRLSRWLLWSIESDRVWSVEESVYPVLETIVDSLNLLTRDGVCGRRFITTELRGDQSWFRYIFRHKAYWLANNVCFRCKASAKPTNLNYTLNGMPGGWESTIRSTDDFVLDELTDPLCFPQFGPK
jgi:hypothetical protein